MAKKKKKKRVLKIKNIILLLLIITSIVGLFYYALNMPVKNIYIKNNQIVSDEEILTTSGLDNYPPFLLLNKRSIKERLEKNKYIENAKITKKIGNIIEISITEYQPILLTKEGQIILSNGLQLENSYQLSDIPILINEVENEKIYKNFAQKLGTIDRNILRQISQIEYSPVSVDEERFLLYMNDGNLVYITLTKITKINKYDRIKDKLGNQLGIIYLDSGDYVEVKKQVTS